MYVLNGWRKYDFSCITNRLNKYKVYKQWDKDTRAFFLVHKSIFLSSNISYKLYKLADRQTHMHVNKYIL